MSSQSYAVFLAASRQPIAVDTTREEYADVPSRVEVAPILLDHLLALRGMFSNKTPALGLF